MRGVVAALLFSACAFAADGDLHTQSIGDLKLESGNVIRDCVLGYRTYGSLNAARSNAILFPTWFTGRSSALNDLIGPGKLVDSTQFFVITVDALGDGVSSSPSNSRAQPRLRFPEFSIRDMVESQHKLLQDTLKISHLRAVMGISMGGMQTFQWMTSYPDYMDYAIPIVGSPQLSSIDLLLWTAEKHTLEAGSDWHNGDYSSPPAATMRAVSDIHQFALATPEKRVTDLSRSGFAAFLATSEASTLSSFDANDWYRQLQAMLTMDVARDFGGSLPAAAYAVRAKVLVISATQDHMVNPTAALGFARMIHAETVLLTGDCGHLATGCESMKIKQAIQNFLH